jgi:hypothetical protein
VVPQALAVVGECHRQADPALQTDRSHHEEKTNDPEQMTHCPKPGTAARGAA